MEIPAVTNFGSRYDAFRARRYFGSLDGLRAIAILAVIWHHGPGQAAGWRLLRSGHQGVQLFFAISGFLITTLLLRELESTGGISLRRFYARRSLRIFPLYYTVLALYMALMGASGREAAAFWHNLGYFLTYTANWFVSAKAVFGFGWSLATEEQFYCMWPWCEKYLRGKWVIAAMAVILAAALAGRAPWYFTLLPKGAFVRTVCGSIALPICLGVLLAHLLHDPNGYQRAFRWLGHGASPVVTLMAAAIAIQLRLPSLITVAQTVVVAACVIREDHWLTPVLASRPFVQLGKVSYGAYLMHGLVYNVVEIAGNRFALDRHGLVEFAAATLLTLGVASLSYRYYESFFLGLKKWLKPVGQKMAQAV